MQHPLVLLVIDGWGVRKETKGNAIALASTPNYKKLLEGHPHSLLQASQEAVGLPKGQMGGSEVGHMNIGAGRNVYFGVALISHQIATGEFFKNKALISAIETAKKSGHALHVMGLLSDGGVHSHISHLLAFLELCRQRRAGKVFIHIFLDGRDTPQKSAKKYLGELEAKIKQLKVGAIASVSGRYYAMDRDARWNRTEKAYNAIMGKGGHAIHSAHSAHSAEAAIRQAYARGESDEFAKPTAIVGKNGAPVGGVRDGDSLVFFNFRPDRCRQLTRAFTEKKFEEFSTAKMKVKFTTFTMYDKNYKLPYAFKAEAPKNVLAQVLSRKGLRQMRIAETEKYAHVTYFFNGGREAPFPGEERLLVPSPKIATYDLLPEMSAYGVTEEAVKAIRTGKFGFIAINFANADMVGHTGKLDPTIKAVECIDECLGMLAQAVEKANGTLVVTADHGNADKKIVDATPSTAHSLSPVPLIIASHEPALQKRSMKLRNGSLEDVAPTILEIMGLARPKEMTGKSLIVRT